ncbi:MAG: SUMF1/EgtB/PvdO family nonheme iron enzyme [Planctomycetia bacterium]|nr:SUMF1/EgtB/PvdO family nonheme iron enzyme [Planctomycetia bacterium]
MKLVRIPAGEFQMGSQADAPGMLEDELPRHKVRITRPFLMGMYEVTQGEFVEVMQTNPSSFQKTRLLQSATESIDESRLPVDGITWHQAVEFCRKLSDTSVEKEAGRVYCLPTEAEWEYACRAGSTTVFHFGDSLSSTQANFNGANPFGDAEPGPFLNRTQIVGSYAPNAFGLHDMHGNLFEWCADRFERRYYHASPEDDPPGPETGRYRVIRGGDWYSDARDCRSAFRYSDVPEGTFYAVGFRVVCNLVARSTGPTNVAARATGRQPLPEESVTATPSGPVPRPTSGEDWPRWRGPRGDGTWNAPRLATTWPAAGLSPAWTQELGGGYGGVSVSAGRVYVMDRQREPESVERVLCFDAVTGEPLWSHQYSVDYQGVSYDSGPRSTPTVHEHRVYTLGAVGHLHCLDAVTGEIQWSKDLVKDFGARVPLWGLSASPVIFEKLVIIHAALEPEGCYAAFDLTTGEERWRCLPDGAGYATPILIDRHGTAELVGWTANHVRGVEPATGIVRWTIPFQVNYGTAIADPIFQDGVVLVSSYYDGTRAIRLGDLSEEASVVWEDRRNLRALMAQPLYRDGHVYLIDKRHGLTCFELQSGTKLWDDQNQLTPKGRNPQATLVWLNTEDRAIVLNSEGDLILSRFHPRGPLETARANIIDPTWAHPAYAGNCVYARSDTRLVCVLLPEE